jgi:hypothetical protein
VIEETEISHAMDDALTAFRQYFTDLRQARRFGSIEVTVGR